MIISTKDNARTDALQLGGVRGPTRLPHCRQSGWFTQPIRHNDLIFKVLFHRRVASRARLSMDVRSARCCCRLRPLVGFILSEPI